MSTIDQQRAPAPDTGEALTLTAAGSIVALVSLVPTGRLLVEALAPGGKPDLAVLTHVLEASSTWIAALHSLKTALGGSLLSLMIGAGMALLLTVTDIRAKSPLVFALLMPLMVPPQVTALAFAQIGGPASPLLRTLGLAPPIGTPNWFFSEAGIILVLGVQNAPLVFLALRAGLRALPAEVVEAARASGAGPWRTLGKVILPSVLPPLVSGVALAFVSAVGNFGIPAFLGIPAGYTVLPTLIYQRLAGFGPSVLGDMAVLSILVGLLAGVGFLLQALVLRRRDYRLSGLKGRSYVFKLGPWLFPAECAAWASVALMLFLPLTGLVATALVPAYGVKLSFSSVTLHNFAEVLFRQDATIRAFRNSFVLSAGAACLLMLVAVPFAYLVVRRKGPVATLLNAAAELPYAVPGIVLGIAAILLFIQPLPILHVSLYNTIWIILLAYLARFLILCVRPAVSALTQIDPSLEEAAWLLGAGFLMRLRSILLPLLAPATAAGGLLVFMTAFNELTVSALLWSAGNETIGVMTYNFEDAGLSTLAAAISVTSLLVTFVLILATSLLGRRLPPGVIPWRP